MGRAATTSRRRRRRAQAPRWMGGRRPGEDRRRGGAGPWPHAPGGATTSSRRPSTARRARERQVAPVRRRRPARGGRERIGGAGPRPLEPGGAATSSGRPRGQERCGHGRSRGWQRDAASSRAWPGGRESGEQPPGGRDRPARPSLPGGLQRPVGPRGWRDRCGREGYGERVGGADRSSAICGLRNIYGRSGAIRAKTPAAGVAGAGSPKEQHKAMTEREEQKAAQQAFLEAAYADCELYLAMEEEDVVEEYRRAGKLHTYDPDKEWQKRFARVAKLHPSCRWHKQMIPKIEQYMMFLEEDEDDFRIGLHSLLLEEMDFLL